MRTLAQLNRFGAGAFLLAIGLGGIAIATADDKDAAAARPIRVLFVGNSQFYYNNLHRIVESLAESAPKDRPRIITDAKPSERSVAGGASLESHWKRGTGEDTVREDCR
jgi:hypothetical protein